MDARPLGPFKHYICICNVASPGHMCTCPLSSCPPTLAARQCQVHRRYHTRTHMHVIPLLAHIASHVLTPRPEGAHQHTVTCASDTSRSSMLILPSPSLSAKHSGHAPILVSVLGNKLLCNVLKMMHLNDKGNKAVHTRERQPTCTAALSNLI
jgi:hypothetical protein